ncbi:MAG: CHRD domain-containing protein, partial [Pseudomonadota bacterium]
FVNENFAFYGKTLTGAQEVPANTSTATGRGFGRFNPVTLKASFTVTSNVVNPTASHIHTAAPGVIGSVTVPFTQTSPGTWTSSPTASLTTTQGAAFAAGTMYYNVHSAAFPVGEVRGVASGRE